MSVDEETIVQLRDTSPADVLASVDDEERAGHPAYEQPGALRWGARTCAAPDCFEQFVPSPFVPYQRFCGRRCKDRQGARERTGGRWVARRRLVRVVVADRLAA